ncbi:hypothetical protein NX059_008476 [Plenodomus lindquistii]|nr:hypothetical protein NX059_008476 [Plenodomus lindquistii]
MDDETFNTHYRQCRNAGYNHSDALTLCMQYEARYLELSGHQRLYGFADFMNVLRRGRYDNTYESTSRDYYSPRRPSPQGRYYNTQPVSPHAAQVPLPSARYRTEERRPYREPASRPREYIPSSIHAEPPLTSDTYSARGYHTYDAAHPPYPPRRETGNLPPHAAPIYTDYSHRSYNTTERAPHYHHVPQAYHPSSRSSSTPRSQHSPPLHHHEHTNSYSQAPPPPHQAQNESHSSHTPPPQPLGTKPEMDLYIVLEISRSATADEIKKAHRKLSMNWHPDRCAQANKDMATDKMAEINRANDVLSDAKARRFYDRTGCLPGLLY